MVALDGTGAAPHRAQSAQGESTSDPEKNELTAQLGAAASAHVHQTDVAQEKTAAADAAAAENQKRMLTRAQKILADKQSALRRADNLEPETTAASRSTPDPREASARSAGGAAYDEWHAEPQNIIQQQGGSTDQRADAKYAQTQTLAGEPNVQPHQYGPDQGHASGGV